MRDVSNLGLNVYGQNIEVITCNCISFCLFMGRSFQQVFFSSVHLVFFLSNCRSVRVKSISLCFSHPFELVCSFCRSLGQSIHSFFYQLISLSDCPQSINPSIS